MKKSSSVTLTGFFLLALASWVPTAALAQSAGPQPAAVNRATALDAEISYMESRLKNLDGKSSRNQELVLALKQAEQKMTGKVDEIMRQFEAAGIAPTDVRSISASASQRHKLQIELAGLKAKMQQISDLLELEKGLREKVVTPAERLLGLEKKIYDAVKARVAAGEVPAGELLKQERAVLLAEIRLQEMRNGNGTIAILKEKLANTVLEIASAQARFDEAVKQAEKLGPLAAKSEELERLQSWLSSARHELNQLDLAQLSSHSDEISFLKKRLTELREERAKLKF